MSTDTPTPLPPVRRVVTGHRKDGVAVVHSDTTIPGSEVREEFYTSSTVLADSVLG